jgi:hypothetical protein
MGLDSSTRRPIFDTMRSMICIDARHRELRVVDSNLPNRST